MTGALVASGVVLVARAVVAAVGGLGAVEALTLAVESFVVAALALDLASMSGTNQPRWPTLEGAANEDFDVWIVVGREDRQHLDRALDSAAAFGCRATVLDCVGDPRIARVAQTRGASVLGISVATSRRALRTLLSESPSAAVAIVPGSAFLRPDVVGEAFAALRASNADGLVAPPPRQWWTSDVDGHVVLSGLHPKSTFVARTSALRSSIDAAVRLEPTQLGMAYACVLTAKGATVLSLPHPLTDASVADPGCRRIQSYRSLRLPRRPSVLALLSARLVVAGIVRPAAFGLLAASPLLMAASGGSSTGLLVQWSLVAAGVAVRTRLTGERWTISTPGIWSRAVLGLQVAAVVMVAARFAIGELDARLAVVVAVAAISLALSVGSPTRDKPDTGGSEGNVEWAERVMQHRRLIALGSGSTCLPTKT